MAETSSGGCVRFAARSVASTRASASSSATVSVPSGCVPDSTWRNASATGINGISGLLRTPVAGLAAALFQKADALDAHAFLDRLDHVVDGQARDRHGGQRLHLDPGLAVDLDGRLYPVTGQGVLRIDLDLDLGDRQRMAERDERMRALGRHDAGEPRGAEHVALERVAGDDALERVLAHGDMALGDRDALGLRLAGDVHHARFAALVDVAERRLRGWRGRLAAPRRLGLAGHARHSAAAVWRASRARVAAATSAWRIRLSPMRKVEIPTFARRARSAGA